MQVLIETKRLILRQFTSTDLDHIFALDNDPDVMRYLNGGTPTEREVIERDILPGFLQYDSQQPGVGFWAVDERTTGKFLGWVSLRPTREVKGEMVLGYRFHKVTWGKGFATEATQAMIAHGFSELGMQRVVATTYQDNVASQRVMEKLGMILVRRFRITSEELGQSDTFHTDAEDVWDGDDVEYALDKGKWERSRSSN